MTKTPVGETRLLSLLVEADDAARQDPFSNAFLRFGLKISLRVAKPPARSTRSRPPFAAHVRRLRRTCIQPERLLGTRSRGVGRHQAAGNVSILWPTVVSNLISAAMQALRQAAPDAGSYLRRPTTRPDWRRACWGEHWDRLNAVKRRYDPEDCSSSIRTPAHERRRC